MRAADLALPCVGTPGRKGRSHVDFVGPQSQIPSQRSDVSLAGWTDMILVCHHVSDMLVWQRLLGALLFLMRFSVG